MLIISESHRNPALKSSSLPRLDPQDLRGFEKVAIPVCDFVNTNAIVKTFIQWFVRTVTATWISAATRNLWELHGLERVRDLKPTQGVILLSNHRSFFDMYVTSAVLYKRANFLKRLFFPVRTDYFYTHPLGLLVNLMISGGAMWPPVFRDERKFRLNPVGISQMIHALHQPGAVMGIHPEGTRGKGPDPYEMLPARPGVGHLLKACHPDTLVLHYFIVGMSNNVLREVGRNFRAPGKRGDPIRITFGTPIRAGSLNQEASAQDLADEMQAHIRALGEEDRARPHPSR